MIEKIVSGGQTGVDQAALLVATEENIPIGGWCPLNGLDENGDSILKKYPLKEVTGLPFADSVTERTKRNIEDSDGTLIIAPTIPLPKKLADGTLLTIHHSEEKQKPFLLIAITDNNAINKIRNWVEQHKIKILNIAGPRESSCEGIYEQSCDLLRQIFHVLKPQFKF